MDIVVPGSVGLQVGVATQRGVGHADQAQARLRDMGFETVTFQPEPELHVVGGFVSGMDPIEARLLAAVFRAAVEEGF